MEGEELNPQPQSLQNLCTVSYYENIKLLNSKSTCHINSGTRVVKGWGWGGGGAKSTIPTLNPPPPPYTLTDRTLTKITILQVSLKNHKSPQRRGITVTKTGDHEKGCRNEQVQTDTISK